ncbi:hypothetical protein O7635_33305 [Asanoa sp. WMMD1127]|uniref:hypothetical protein n=1 Tax=Asanoa sp. WMMD1127 TaxID=3016107 RepID=UPI0024161E17|nr:hypothetical protein [Asanoa sp. WMMD1127]MDG4826754.1 hypothetical protein [Asanoa sp. WMMD1127]
MVLLLLTPWLAFDQLTRTAVAAGVGLPALLFWSITPVLPLALALFAFALGVVLRLSARLVWAGVGGAVALALVAFPFTHVAFCAGAAAVVATFVHARRRRSRSVATGALALALTSVVVAAATATWSGPVGEGYSRMAGGQLINHLDRVNVTRANGEVISVSLVNEDTNEVVRHYPPEVFDLDQEGPIVGAERCRFRVHPLQLSLRDLVVSRLMPSPMPACAASHWHVPAA